MTTSKYFTPAAVDTEVHTRAERHMATEGGSYQEAAHAVLKADPELAQAYAMPSSRVTAAATRPAVPVPAPAPLTPGLAPSEEVHRRTVALMESDASLTYQMAANLILAADPALKAAYARS